MDASKKFTNIVEESEGKPNSVFFTYNVVEEKWRMVFGQWMQQSYDKK